MKAQLTAADVMRNDREWVQLEPHDAEILRRRAAHAGLVDDASPRTAGMTSRELVIWSSGHRSIVAI